MKTTYLSELDAARAESAQVSEWLRTAQEQLLQKDRLLQKAIRYIERQSGSTHVEYLKFQRSHDSVHGSQFVITDNGRVLDPILRGQTRSPGHKRGGFDAA